MWRHFKTEHFGFKLICGYLFFEFTRLQSIFPVLDILPWPRLCLIGALIGALADPSVKWATSAANKWMYLFLLGVIASVITANYPETAREHFIDFFIWFIIYFLIINIVNTKERLYIFLCIFIFAAAKIAIGTSKNWAMSGFAFRKEGLMGPAGSFQNSGELAILMLTLFPLPFLIQRATGIVKARWEQILLTLFWVAPIMTIIGASSRGSQLALAAQLLIIFRKSAFKLKSLLTGIVIIAAIVALMPQAQLDRLSNSGKDDSSLQRLLYWERGREMIWDNPVFGVGFYNFAPYFQTHHSADLLTKEAQLPHNIFIQVGTDGGIPLIVYLVALIAFCLTTAVRLAKDDTINPINRAIAAGLGYGVLGFALAGQFVTVTYYPFLWVHLAMLVSLNNISRRDKLLTMKTTTLNTGKSSTR